MKFYLSTISRLFWHHFGHLRIVDVDEFGLEVRVLPVQSCVACARLWMTLTPVTIHGHEIYPATKATRYHALRRQVFVRDAVAALGAPQRGEARRVRRSDGSVGLERVKRFSDYRMRRPLERY